MFFHSNELFNYHSNGCSLLKMTSCCLNNFILNLYAAVALQLIVTLIVNSLCIKILLDCFLVHLLVHIYIFYDLKDSLLWPLSNFCDLILLLYVFQSTTISITIYYCFYTISFKRFSAYINHIYIVYSTNISGLLISSFFFFIY